MLATSKGNGHNSNARHFDGKWPACACLFERKMASDLIAAWTSDLIAEWNAAIESQSAIQSLYDFQRSNRCRLTFGDHFSLRSHRSQRSNRCFEWFSAIQSLSTHFRRLFCLLIHAFHSGCSLAYHDHRWHTMTIVALTGIAANLKN